LARAPKIEEERPPHDALDGVSLPRQTSAFVGHRDAEQSLLAAYRSGRMHHGWIIAGERGIGKATLAFRLARFMLAHPDPRSQEVATAKDLSISPEHPVARRIATGVHGNLLHLQREWNDKRNRYRTELQVETIRRIIPFLGTTAGEGGWRIVIVDPADDMNPSAANAILKNLEEPPQRTLFLLVARSRGALLPTIRSRTRTLSLDPLSPADTLEVVRKVAPDLVKNEDAAVAGELSAGSPRRFIELMREDGVEIYCLMRKAIETNDRPAQFKLAGLASSASGTQQFLELFDGYLARRVKDLPEPVSAGQSPVVPLVTWAALWEKAAFTGREVETYNLDRRQFVLDLLETSAAVLRPSESPN
jgi:DNA polymerase-3 subunit delta'